MNKIIKYEKDLGNTQNFPAFLNKELIAAYNNDKVDTLTFISDDLYDNCKDPNKFISDYLDFMNVWDLPYVFFPYYVYFNKQLPDMFGKPNPRLLLNIKKVKQINVVCMPAYGFLIIDVKKIKSFHFIFDEFYTELFWLQDMIEQCFQNKLWISNCCFIDRFESWKDLKEQTIKGHYTNTEKFNKEKAEYDKLGVKYHNIQEFINLFKEKYKL